MIGDPLGRLGRDVAAAGRDLDDLSKPRRESGELIADAMRDEAPVLTGYLRSSIGADDQGAYAGASYAGFAAARNPYDERAIDRVEWDGPFSEFVDDVLDHHIQFIYT